MFHLCLSCQCSFSSAEARSMHGLANMSPFSSLCRDVLKNSEGLSEDVLSPVPRSADRQSIGCSCRGVSMRQQIHFPPGHFQTHPCIDTGVRIFIGSEDSVHALFLNNTTEGTVGEKGGSASFKTEHGAEALTQEITSALHGIAARPVCK